MLEVKKELEDREYVQGAGLLNTIAAGGMWPEARRHEAKQRPDPKCQRCQVEDEDEIHMMWGCICNDELEEQAVQDTKHFKAQVLAQKATFPANGQEAFGQ